MLYKVFKNGYGQAAAKEPAAALGCPTFIN
jgi:hypothetical protein